MEGSILKYLGSLIEDKDDLINVLRDNINTGLRREQDLKQKLVSLEIELKKRGD